MSWSLFAQQGIQTSNTLGVEELVRDEFIKGNCRNVSQITSIGNKSLSIGQFDFGTNSIKMNDGIIISTGDIALAEGPNISSEASRSFGVVSNDPDLGRLATDSLFDATGIEFDFVPLDDHVSFRYVFASEEYCEFVGSPFNDVFGFFVSGPGINGTFSNNAINVASLTGTNQDVSINTVNHIDNVNFYVNNVTNLDAESCMIDYTPDAEDEIEYDGFTVPLTASFEVIPCETYRIRLIIGDVGDDQLDSGVFLESNSFDIGEGIDVRAEVPGSDEPLAFEGCADGQFVFTRSAISNVNEALTIDYSISSDSKARNGIDFEEIPLRVTIPEGEESFVLPITVIEDNEYEGPENLKLELVYDCDCINPTISELIINEVQDFSIQFDEINVCANQTFIITPQIVGGVPPFEFLWENGMDTDSLQTSVSVPTQYGIIVTDFCGNTVESTAVINIQDIPVANLSGNYNFCETVVTGIPIELEGHPPWRLSYSIDGGDDIIIDNIRNSPYDLVTTTVGTFELTSFGDAYCDGQAIGSAMVGSSTGISVDLIPPTCYNSADGSIEIADIDGVSPFTITWNIETLDPYHLEELAEGMYTLNIEDGDGCTYEETFTLVAASDKPEDCVAIYIPNIFAPGRDGPNDTFSIFFDSGSEIQNINSMQVYSRWGELIFEQRNLSPGSDQLGWKGDYRGQALLPGIYIYKIEIAFTDGSTLLRSGTVMLVR